MSLRSLFLPLAVLIALFLGSGGLAHQHLRAIRENGARVDQTHQVIHVLQGFRTHMVDAETGQRGYLLTLDPAYLAPYTAARAQIAQDLQRLAELVPGPRFHEVETITQAKLAELQETIALEHLDPAAARRVVLTHLGKNLMDDLRRKLDSLLSVEQDQLAQRSRESRHSLQVAALSSAVSALAGLLLAMGFALQLRRYLADREGHAQELARQHQWLAVTLTSIGDAVIATDPAGAVTFMNPVAEQLTGWTALEARGQPLTTVFNIVNEVTGLPAVNPAGRVLKERVVLGLANHTALISRQGKTFPIEDSAAPILDATGVVNGVVLVFHDVTEKKATEKTLQASELRYHSLFERLIEGFCIVEVLFDPAGRPIDYRFLEVNPAFEAQTGLRDAPGKRMRELAPDHEAHWFELYGRIALTGEPAHFVNEAKALNRWYDVHAYRVGNPEEHRVAILFHDLTDTKRAEGVLRESEERFRSFADAIPQLTWMADADGAINWYNQRWYEYTGTTPEQMAGWGWQAVHDPALLPQVMEAWQASLKTGSPFEMVFPILGRDGVFRPFLTRVVPVRGQDGHIFQWFGTNTDVTEREQAKEALREEARRKDAFLAVLGHELRNPLAPIRNAVYLLSHGPLDPASTRANCAILERQVAHMVRLVDDLLDVSRIARGSILLKKEEVDLVATVRCLIEDHRALVADRGVALESRLPSSPIWIEADPTRITQSISNLLHNAIKFTDPGGRIVITVGPVRSGQCLIQVQDDGAGIAAELLAGIFDPFMQSPAMIGRSRGGLGLGLALAKGLIELHGGTLAARSDGPGRGAEFSIQLPMVSRTVPPGGQAPVAERPETPSPRRILVVEDLVDAAVTLQMVLKMAGHDVAIAHDGKTALALAEAQQPDLVLCDIGLPGELDGWDVARGLRGSPRLGALHLIAMTGFGTQEDKERAAKAGFDAHLTKPVDPEQLVRIVAELRPGLRPDQTPGLPPPPGP